MAKPELGNSLLPVALIAGLLSGTLLRSPAPADTSKSGESVSGSDRVEAAAATARWVSDLRPAMDAIAAALGADPTDLDAQALPLRKPESAPAQAADGPKIREAMESLRIGLDDDAGALTCAEPTPSMLKAAHLLAISVQDDEGKAKTRTEAVTELLKEYRDWHLLRSLARSVRNGQRLGPSYDVDFIVATIPDYVDSNSGWLADQNLAAIQSGMTPEEYVFDRVKLIDWSRSVVGSVATVSSSRLHEEQPGAMIFRRVHADAEDEAGELGVATERNNLSLRVVLLVPETPTAGVHQAALRNSLRFIRDWNACSGVGPRALRVLGPTFSGSIVSLASVLREPTVKDSFTARLVITGSANADENVQQMATFSGGAIYLAAIQRSSVLKARMADFLKWMNPDWTNGRKVALLVESNTAYGQPQLSRTSGQPGVNTTDKAPLSEAAIFTFPLHVAQLRSDAPAFSQPGAGLFPGAIIPLNLREPSPPTDLVPALRPQMTSPVVESTVASMLDTIRHEKLTAVGIVATDDRDVLFLAREVKRALPDVQLFLFGTHALYLHPDYVPYLRGALVASSYSLSLANQPEIGDPSERYRREPFPSMGAEGIFHATRALLSDNFVSEAAAAYSAKTRLPYCPVSAPTCLPVAPASINVIGEDGFWSLSSAPLPPVSPQPATAPSDVETEAAPESVPAPPDTNAYPLPPLPGRIIVAAGLIVVFVLAHVVALYLIRTWLKEVKVLKEPETRQKNPEAWQKALRAQRFLELPFVRVLAPPVTVRKVVRNHRIALGICFGLLASVAAWAAAIILPFALPRAVVLWLAWPLWFLLLVGIVAAAVKLYGPSHAATDAPAEGKPAENERAEDKRANKPTLTIGERTVRLLFVGILVTCALFVVLTIKLILAGTGTLKDPAVLSRLVGGSIVSPAALTLCLIAALYIAVITGVRRLSLVGRGYTDLSRNSPTFALLRDSIPTEEQSKDEGSQLAALLDMPAANLPSIYPLGLLIVLLFSFYAMWQVSTIEGRVFSWFVRIGSLTALGAGLLFLAQGLATWTTARSHLRRLARSSIEPHFARIAAHVPWEISLAPPRLTELLPVARLADSVMRDFRAMATPDPYVQRVSKDRRELADFQQFRDNAASSIGVRGADVQELSELIAKPSHVENLRAEMNTRQHAALIQSESWFRLWRLSDAIVSLMESTSWRRASAGARVVAVGEPTGAGSPPNTWRQPLEPNAWLDQLDPPIREAFRSAAEDAKTEAAKRDGWFTRCEQFVALEMAFVMRDIVARTITCLVAAMVSLTLLTASHLFYTFNGRASMLTVDLLAVGGAALAVVWILVDMERDHVLSRLKSTTPGRVDINWDFVKRLAVYGVLPLLVVIASLFPEIGGTLFGWLEPLRKLSTF
jgi:hypothetical protein